LTECPYCGDKLMEFMEELEDGTVIYVVVCPTCYRYSSLTNGLNESIQTLSIPRASC